MPPTVAVPAVGLTRLSTILSVVVLPAPFGPRNPVTRPGSTVNDRSSTARTLRYCLVRPETTICPSDISLPPRGRLVTDRDCPRTPCWASRRPDIHYERAGQRKGF